MGDICGENVQKSHIVISCGSRLGVGSGGFEGVGEDGVGVYIVVGGGSGGSPLPTLLG